MKPQNQNGKSKSQNGKPKQLKSPIGKSPIVDARLKIISKKRTQITDAREKLAELAKQKDARLKLNQLRGERVIIHYTHHTMSQIIRPTQLLPSNSIILYIS